MTFQSSAIRLLIAIAALTAVATSLRLYRLGDWPFDGDELATLEEEESVYGHNRFDPGSQSYRLPRLAPLAFWLHHLDYQLIGRDEYGSRLLVALCGAAQVGALFALGAPSLGWPAALSAALIMLLWPEHLFQSQQNRFYTFAALLAQAGLLLGGWGLAQRRAALFALACLAIVAAVFAHSICAVLFLPLAVGLVALEWQARPLAHHARYWAPLTLAALVCGAWIAFHLAGSDWNSAETWGYTSAHAVQAALNRIGWPIGLVAAVGALLLWGRRTPDAWLWLSAATLWALTAALLPRVMVYHPAYVFPLATAVLVLAGVATGKIFELLWSVQPAAAAAWLAIVPLVSLPSTLSHYRDGSRYDHRTAARYLVGQVRPGECVAAVAPSLVHHYAPEFPRPIGIAADSVGDVEKLATANSPLWIVLPCSRGGAANELRTWLDAHAQRMFPARVPRFDYFDYSVEVYRCAAPRR